MQYEAGSLHMQSALLLILQKHVLYPIEHFCVLLPQDFWSSDIITFKSSVTQSKTEFVLFTSCMLSDPQQCQPPLVMHP